MDLGSLVVSQGQDFTLHVAPGGVVPVAYGATQVLTLTAVGLNGFTGGIALSYTLLQGPSVCFQLTNPPSAMAANSQVSIVVSNFYCSGADLFINGSAIVNGSMSIRRGIANGAQIGGVELVPAAPGEFSIGAGAPSPAVLSPQGSVSYPVTVTGISGQTGSVTLSVTGMPAGVGLSISPAQVYLSGPGSKATSYLTLSGSASTPPGTYALYLTGASAGVSHVATFALSIQVDTFQISSPTGSAIVHNTGQEVQATHTVPAGNAPTYTTCDNPDPSVTCRVISSTASTVTLGITGGSGAAHGTRVLRLNGGRAQVHAAFADGIGGPALPRIVVQAGGHAETFISGLPAFLCFEGSCGYDLNGPWMSGFESPGGITVWDDPPLNTTPGTYAYTLEVCGGFWNPDDGDGCATDTGFIEVDAPPPPPPPSITSMTSSAGPARGPVGASADVVIQGFGFAPNPSVSAPGITVSIISSTNTVIHATFNIPVSQPGGNVGVTITTGGQTSSPANFLVQVPTSLVRQTYPGNPPAGAPNGYGPLEMPDGTATNGNVVNAAGQVLLTDRCGVYRNLAYSVVDQESPAQIIQGLTNVQMNETFSNFSGAGTVPAPLTAAFDLSNCPGGIGSNQCAADVIDNIYLGHPDGTCLASNENQSFTQAFSVTIGKTDTSLGKDFTLTTTNSVSRGNFNGTLKVDVTVSNP